MIVIVAIKRSITCPFCPAESAKLAVPVRWTTEYAMAWFHSTHLLEHVEQMLSCAACVSAMWDASPHRPCFEPDCDCVCSRTTTPERTADADD